MQCSVYMAGSGENDENDTTCTQRFMLNQVDPGFEYGCNKKFIDEVNLSWFKIHR